MALDYDALADSLFDIIEARVADTLTAEEAREQASAVLATLVPGNSLPGLTAEVQDMIARIDGMILRPDAPVDAVGEIGSLWFRYTTGEIFGPKEVAEAAPLGVWPAEPLFSLVGPAITLEIGDVVAIPGGPAAAEVDATDPANLVLDLDIPVPLLSIGGVTTSAAGSAAAVTLDMTDPLNPVLDFDLPRGAVGPDTLATITTFGDLLIRGETRWGLTNPAASVNYTRGLELVFGSSPYIRKELAVGTTLAGVLAGQYTFARNSISPARSSTGALTSFAANTIRQTDLGLLIEPARTNKCQRFNANPTNTTGMTLVGDAAATLTVVDDSAALAAAGLNTVCTSGKVFKFDNSAGTGNAFCIIPGAVGNLNQHIQSCYGRGSGSWAFGLHAGVDSGGVGLAALGAAYARRNGVSGSVPTTTSGEMRIQVTAGTVLYFILYQLEEGPAVTSPIVVSGAAATRPKDDFVITHSVASGQDFTLVFEVEFSRDTGALQTALTLSDGSAANRISLLRSSAGSFRGDVVIASVTTALGGTAKAGARTLKGALSRSGNTYALVLDGGAEATQVLAGMPNLTTLIVGNSTSDALLSDFIRPILYVPRALTLAQRQAMTT